MAHPVYVLLPVDVEWIPVPGTTAQRTAPIRWYLRQRMPTAATQTAVLVGGEEHEHPRMIAAVVEQAESLGGIAVDAMTQEPIGAAAADVTGS